MRSSSRSTAAPLPNPLPASRGARGSETAAERPYSLARAAGEAADRRSAGEGPRGRTSAPVLEAPSPWPGPGRGSGHMASPAQRRGRGEAAGAGAGREGPEVPAGLRGRRPQVGGRGSVRTGTRAPATSRGKGDYSAIVNSPYWPLKMKTQLRGAARPSSPRIP